MQCITLLQASWESFIGKMLLQPQSTENAFPKFAESQNMKLSATRKKKQTFLIDK